MLDYNVTCIFKYTHISFYQTIWYPTSTQKTFTTSRQTSFFADKLYVTLSETWASQQREINGVQVAELVLVFCTRLRVPERRWTAVGDGWPIHSRLPLSRFPAQDSLSLFLFLSLLHKEHTLYLQLLTFIWSALIDCVDRFKCESVTPDVWKHW